MSKFIYYGRELETFHHMFNSTYYNERSVELAVAIDFMSGVDPSNVLEVGNVLGHYEIGGHVVVDRYESPTMLQHLMDWPYYNVDVFDIAVEVGSAWDLIIAISTLEHVGFDTPPLDETASVRAIAYLQSLLARDGRMLVTVPCGFHPVLDAVIVEEITGATRSCTLVRAGSGDAGEVWVQTDEPTILPYGATTPWAESVWVAEFDAILR